MTELSQDELRHKMKQERARLSGTYRAQCSDQIGLRISTLEAYQKAKHIAFYHAMETEIDLAPLWQKACEEQKICYFPVLNDQSTLTFLPADQKTPFKKNNYGIWEPDVSHDMAIPANQLDLILVPLIAFDFYCHRIGMGAGYYDRTLQDASHPTLIGVAYQFQRIDEIKPQPWDVPLHAVVTQRAIYWRNRIHP